MDIKDYITSGILERYALGSVSNQEKQEVECMSHIYPEIKEELDSIQQSIENYVTANAVEPPPSLKPKIMAAIDDVEQIKPETIQQSNDDNNIQDDIVMPKKTNVVPMYWKSIAAGVALLLVAMSGLWFATNNTLNTYSDENTALADENTKIKEQFAVLEENSSKKEYINFILSHSATKKIDLNGTDGSPESIVRAYWNTQTKGVFLKVDNLPSIASNEQFQLWAIVDGTPVDMGILDIDFQSKEVYQMPFELEGGQAFAITVEKKGGSKTPTLSTMKVIGNI